MPCSRFLVAIALAMTICLVACSNSHQKIDLFKTIPADTELVASVNVKKFLTLYKDITKTIPEEGKIDPPLDVAINYFKTMTGLDPSTLSDITLFGSASNREQLTIAATGVDIKTLKGEKSSTHKGVVIHHQWQGFFADANGKGVVWAQNEDAVKKSIDALKGDARTLHDSEKGKMLDSLMKIQPGFDVIRVYALTDNLPIPGLPFTFTGGGFFLHPDKGMALSIFASKEKVKQINTMATTALAAFKLQAMMGNMPVSLDKDTEAALKDLLAGLQIETSSGSFTVYYKGSLAALIKAGIAVHAAKS
jgi:hypothetical protein